MNRTALLQSMVLIGLTQAVISSAIARDTPEDTAALHSIGEIHKLPSDQLPNRVPVDMECVVAFYSSDWAILFLHDGVAGMYAGGSAGQAIKTGDSVRVRGVIGPNRFIIDYSLELSDSGIALPPPKQGEFQRLNDGLDDSQYVKISGQLVSVSNDNSHTVLEMNAVGGGRFRALIHQSLASPDRLRQMLGKQLTVQGIAGVRLDHSSELIGFQLWLGALSDVTVLQQDSSGDDVTATRISDCGIGMDTQTIERMVDPFYSTKFSGRGLGLSTVLGIVRGHKGSIRVDAAPGTGTRFDVLLPASNETSSRESEIVVPYAVEVGDGRVLVVDDEESVLNFVCRTLQMAGLKVTGVTRASDALEHFRNDDPPYDCVISDLTMPEMNGDELARQLLQIRPAIRIILCSGFNENEIGNEQPGLAAAAFLKKPFQRWQLVDLTLSLIAETRSPEIPVEPAKSGA